MTLYTKIKIPITYTIQITEFIEEHMHCARANAVHVYAHE